MYAHVGFFNEDLQCVELNQTGIQLDCVETIPKILNSPKEISEIPYVSFRKRFTVIPCCLHRKCSLSIHVDNSLIMWGKWEMYRHLHLNHFIPQIRYMSEKQACFCKTFIY